MFINIMRFNRHIIFGRTYYNTYCNLPSYYLSDEGITILKASGWHPDKNPFVDDDVEDILLQKYLLKCVSLPSSEYQYDHLNFLFLYGSILG